ncbi:PKD domain-containing protein, partial [Candidatus Daviesbacteria bacterium]|nr:PKD domain-containing protein [Candidatus Daviesbacteria bacterium]
MRLPKNISQAGIAHLMLLVAVVGLVVFLLISNTFDFKDKLFGSLFPKPSSQAMTGATDTSYNLGILVLKYFPLTPDGQKIDINTTGDVGDLYSTVRQRTIDVTNNLISDLPKASSYLGYSNPATPPSLNYQVVDTKEYTQPVPILTDDTRRPNYNQIMTNQNICNYVDNQNVREVWLWAYQGGNYPGTSTSYLKISESKMSGPFGDISNSNRYNDMPICKNTYRVYTFNYSRGTSEAMESWGHQIEAEISAIDSNLFRNLWQGSNYPQTLNTDGRCGSAHNPPNARSEYNRNNSTPQKSDCLNWNPDSLGVLSDISCSNWGCADINDANNASLNYQIWNWQNLPGRNNTKTYQGKQLRNWWDVHGDFDTVMASNKSLTVFLQSPNPTPTPVPQLTVSCIPLQNLANPNTVSWEATVYGGVMPYQYNWTGTDGLIGTTQTVSKTYTGGGYKTASATVKDNEVVPQTKTVSCGEVFINYSYKRVFISSDTTNGNFAGISSGDVVCGYLAQNAKLGGQWMAWLSDSKT